MMGLCSLRDWVLAGGGGVGVNSGKTDRQSPQRPSPAKAKAEASLPPAVAAELLRQGPQGAAGLL